MGRDCPLNVALPRQHVAYKQAPDTASALTHATNGKTLASWAFEHQCDTMVPLSRRYSNVTSLAAAATTAKRGCNPLVNQRGCVVGCWPRARGCDVGRAWEAAHTRSISHGVALRGSVT